jgi:hypothetical protein
LIATVDIWGADQLQPWGDGGIFIAVAILLWLSGIDLRIGATGWSRAFALANKEGIASNDRQQPETKRARPNG